MRKQLQSEGCLLYGGVLVYTYNLKPNQKVI